jgi:hypothetical protein
MVGCCSRAQDWQHSHGGRLASGKLIYSESFYSDIRAMTSSDQPKPASPDRSCFDLLQSQDELGALIRAHFQIDARLQRVLEALTPHPRQLPDLCYQQRAHLAVALGLDCRMLPVIQMLGHLRNRAARYFSAGLTDTTVNQLFGLLGKDDRAAVLAMHRERAGSDCVYQQAPPLQRFIVIAAIVDQFLAAAIAEAGGKSAAAASGELESDEDQPGVIAFEWSASALHHARDFASSEALYSYLTVRDWS